MRKNILFLIGITGTAVCFLSLFLVSASADYKFDYYDFYEMETLLQNLETQSFTKTPNVFSLQTIGNSHLGNPIYAVKFSDNPDQEEDNEPDVVIDSGIHANEWLPVESNIYFLQYLFDAYYNDLHPDHAEVADLVHNFEIWIIPMLNPDGRIRDDFNSGDPENFWTATTYHSGDSDGWRMNVQEVNCPAKPGGTNIGIDINRSWSYKFWEDSDCTGNYHGAYPLEPTEAKVLKQFINNHMVNLVYHKHSALGTIFSNSGTAGLGAYLTVEMDSVYEEEGLLDPLLAITNEIEMSFGQGNVPREALLEFQIAAVPKAADYGICNGMFMTGQYFNWLFSPIDCILAADNKSRRTIQCVFYEYPINDTIYGHPNEGKIGQYAQGDASNSFHPSSGEIDQWIISRSVEINKYIIKQSRYPFSPRYHTDLSRRPEAPDTDLAIVGAKISEVGGGIPGSFSFGADGRDLLYPGSKRVTWNVQNNGTSTRTIDSRITICTVTDDPNCLSPTTAVLTRVDVPPEAIETFYYEYEFEHCKDYSVTLTTGESNIYDNDHKIFVFTITGDTDCDGILDEEDNCPTTPNGSLLGTCVTTKGGMIVSYRVGNPKDYITCDSDDDCTPTGGTCQMEQGDCNGNTVGDVCECYANFNYPTDLKVNASDLGVFKLEYGRIDCNTTPPPCRADGNDDGKVNAQDLGLFKNEYGRIDCPALP